MLYIQNWRTGEDQIWNGIRIHKSSDEAGGDFIKSNKKKKIIILSVVSIVAAALTIAGRIFYVKSPMYIMKQTVMWYEKDFTIPIFCKKVRFE